MAMGRRGDRAGTVVAVEDDFESAAANRIDINEFEHTLEVRRGRIT